MSELVWNHTLSVKDALLPRPVLHLRETDNTFVRQTIPSWDRQYLLQTKSPPEKNTHSHVSEPTSRLLIPQEFRVQKAPGKPLYLSETDTPHKFQHLNIRITNPGLILNKHHLGIPPPHSDNRNNKFVHAPNSMRRDSPWILNSFLNDIRFHE